MTVYEFERVGDGALVEADYPWGEAPSLGEMVEIEGYPCRRVVSLGSNTPVKDIHFTSVQLPPYTEMPDWYGPGQDWDKDKASATYGQPRWSSKKKLDEFLASHPEVKYGEMPALSERQWKDGKKYVSSKFKTELHEGPPPGQQSRRGRMRPRKGFAG